jgi:hypothetical protein
MGQSSGNPRLTGPPRAREPARLPRPLAVAPFRPSGRPRASLMQNPHRDHAPTARRYEARSLILVVRPPQVGAVVGLFCAPLARRAEIRSSSSRATVNGGPFEGLPGAAGAAGVRRSDEWPRAPGASRPADGPGSGRRHVAHWSNGTSSALGLTSRWPATSSRGPVPTTPQSARTASQRPRRTKQPATSITANPVRSPAQHLAARARCRAPRDAKGRAVVAGPTRSRSLNAEARPAATRTTAFRPERARDGRESRRPQIARCGTRGCCRVITRTSLGSCRRTSARSSRAGSSAWA